jgi:magnesium transporter
MIMLYRADGSARPLAAAEPTDACPDDTVWIDLHAPTRDEEQLVERVLGIAVPTRDELKDIEPSSRLYSENGAIYMTASIVWRADSGQPELVDVGFVLSGGRLVTIRYEEPKSIGLFIAAFPRCVDGRWSGIKVLTRMLETISDRSAEILEMAERKVDGVSRRVFAAGTRGSRRGLAFPQGILFDIGEEQRLVAKTRDSLASLYRLLTFFYALQVVQDDKDIRELCRTITRDVQSLSEHATFVSGNITFLLDASLGFINLEQNAIIKIFSIASVVFLPPTLAASIYGMNFKIMPELDWSYGYPFALLVMIVSAVVPFIYFRWKGWL